MNSYERDLLNYLLAWMPYGGPPPATLQPEFGVDMSRAIQIVGQLNTADLSVDERCGRDNLMLHSVQLRVRDAHLCKQFVGV